MTKRVAKREKEKKEPEAIATPTPEVAPIALPEVPEKVEAPPLVTVETDLRSEKMSRIAKTIAGQHGDNSMLYLKEHPEYAKVQNWVSTQSVAIDLICSGKADGSGGLPVGRIVELYGDPSSGKSLLLTQILAEVQRRGGIAVLYDPEATFDSYFASRVGCNVEELLYTKGYKDVERDKMVLSKDGNLSKQRIKVRMPATVERLRAEIEQLIDVTNYEMPGTLLCIGLDSVAAMSTEHELDEPDARDLTKAHEIRTFVKMLEAKIADRNIIFIATNHVIAKINMKNKWEKKDLKRREAPQDDKTAPGGSGLPFGSSVRLDLIRGRDITQNKVLVVGHEIYLFTNKNKCYSAHKQTTVDMYFDSGLDRYSGFMEVLLAKEIIEDVGDLVYRYKGTRFKRKHQTKGPGKSEYIGLDELIEKHPEILTMANEVEVE